MEAMATTTQLGTSDLVGALLQDHAEARRLLGYFRSGEEWRQPNPLVLRLKIANKIEDDEKVLETLSAQISIILTARDDVQLSQDVRGIEKLGSCDLAASVVIGKSPVIKFFDMPIGGPTVYASIKLDPKTQWGGRAIPGLQIQGEVPASVPDARTQVLGDAFTRSSKEIHDLLDQVVQERLKQLEAAVNGKSPPGKAGAGRSPSKSALPAPASAPRFRMLYISGAGDEYGPP